MTNIIQVTYSNYLQDDYEKGYETYPQLSFTSAEDITRQTGRDYGCSDAPIIGLILENGLYVAFSMNDSDSSKQQAIIYDAEDNMICHSLVKWLKDDNEAVNMVDKLTSYFNDYATIIGTSPINNHMDFRLHDEKPIEKEDRMNELVENFMNSVN